MCVSEWTGLFFIFMEMELLNWYVFQWVKGGRIAHLAIRGRDMFPLKEGRRRGGGYGLRERRVLSLMWSSVVWAIARVTEIHLGMVGYKDSMEMQGLGCISLTISLHCDGDLSLTWSERTSGNPSVLTGCLSPLSKSPTRTSLTLFPFSSLILILSFLRPPSLILPLSLLPSSSPSSPQQLNPTPAPTVNSRILSITQQQCLRFYSSSMSPWAFLPSTSSNVSWLLQSPQRRPLVNSPLVQNQNLSSETCSTCLPAMTGSIGLNTRSSTVCSI